MFKLKQLVSGGLFILFICGTVLGQENPTPVEKPREAASTAPPLVTATASAKRVRFVSPGTVVQLRLEVYNEAGQKLFDTELHGGNVLDWHLQDGAGERLPASSYACVLTIKSLSGRISQRVGLVTVNDKKAAVEAAGGVQLSSAQQQVIGPVENNSAFTVLQQSEAEAITAITHDGSDGQMTSTKGALTFRTGDFFAGKDREHMRITEDGKVGIGTDKPAATLDVAGSLRVSEGVRFSDGTTLDAASGKLSVRDAKGDLVNAGGTKAAGTGTLNQIAKWTETGGAGTLGDSLLKDSAGRIEVFSPSPGSGVNPTILNPNNVPGFAQFQFYPASGPNANMSFTVVPRGTGAANNRAQFSIFGTDLFADATNYEFASLRARGTDFVFGTGKSGSGQTRPFMLAAGFLNDNITNNGQLYLATNGNVGISNLNPLAPLDVTGKINTSTQYNIGGNRVLTVTATSNTFAGIGAGTNSTGDANSFFGRSAGGALTNSGNANSFFGERAGGANTTGDGNSFFGSAAGVSNTTGLANSFFGLSAGSSNSTGSDNSYFGLQAGFSNTGGANNSFFGRSAGAANTNSDNSFFGAFAGQSNTFGNANSYFGVSAGSANTNGNGNSFFGYAAGFANTAGANSFFGVDAGYSNTSGNNNCFFGHLTGKENTTGATNSFFGANAGVANATGDNNSFFGSDAGHDNKAAGNSFFGAEAGFSNNSGIRNAFFGRSAGRASVSGNDNTFVGYVAGDNSTGSDNTFVGSDAGGATTLGAGNTFSGSDAGDANTEGNSNTFMGKDAGNTNTTGSANTVIGFGADVGSSGLIFATAIGANAVVNNNNSVVLGRAADTVRIPGDLIVSGTVSKGGGSFKIDHPLDPANKTLSHSFVESPDMMNVYNGNTMTDARGLAVVTLPSYFEALNRDFRYQLTVMGQFAQAIVLEEIAGNHFRIKTSRPRVKVSWQVTGIRHDAYANTRRIPTEELKPETERGTYLHPDAFTQKPTVATGLGTDASSATAKRAPLRR
ncbi:MAG: hypothetical protein ABI596_12120 [Pyrinomonadaceae bacterium]